MELIRVLIVDDQPLMRQGLRAVLRGEAEVCIVADAVDGADAVHQVALHRPDVVLMDVNMPRMSGLEATRLICAADDRPAGVIILTVYDDDETLFEALRAGASGFLLKNAPTDKVMEAIRAVASGEALLSPEATRRLVGEFARRPALAGRRAGKQVRFTGREHDVLELLVQGHNNEEIASLLFLGESTVKSHIQSLYRKLGARDRTQVVIYAYENRLVDGPRPPAEGSDRPPVGGVAHVVDGRHGAR